MALSNMAEMFFIFILIEIIVRKGYICKRYPTFSVVIFIFIARLALQ